MNCGKNKLIVFSYMYIRICSKAKKMSSAENNIKNVYLQNPVSTWEVDPNSER